MSSHSSHFYDFPIRRPTMNSSFQNLVVDNQQSLSRKLKAFVGVLVKNFFVFVDDAPNFG
jgi:hypothetical protein